MFYLKISDEGWKPPLRTKTKAGSLRYAPRRRLEASATHQDRRLEASATHQDEGWKPPLRTKTKARCLRYAPRRRLEASATHFKPTPYGYSSFPHPLLGKALCLPSPQY